MQATETVNIGPQENFPEDIRQLLGRQESRSPSAWRRPRPCACEPAESEIRDHKRSVVPKKYILRHEIAMHDTRPKYELQRSAERHITPQYILDRQSL